MCNQRIGEDPFRTDRTTWRVGRGTSDLQEGRKEGNDLFNDTLNPFYLRLCDVRGMVKDHSDSER